MANLNVVVLDGRLVEDPILLAASDGGDVTLLRLAVARPKPAGSRTAEVDVIDVVVRNGDAKAVARWLGKNCRAGVKGRLYTRTWDAPEGQQSRLHVMADPRGVEFIDSRDRGEQTATRPATQPASRTEAAAASTPPPSPDSETAPAAGPQSPDTSGAAAAREPVHEIIVWADGASRGNPGAAGYGALITTADGKVLAELHEGIGWATNNVAEYRGVIAGLRHAQTLGARRVHLRADAKLVIQQLKGTNRVKSQALVPLHTEALQLVGEFEDVNFEHVTREDNQRADDLANQAVNTQGPVDDPTKTADPQPSAQAAGPTEASAAAAPDSTSAASS